MKLWYYTDWKLCAWAKSASDFRKITGSKSESVLRVCPENIPAPAGYRKCGNLAHDGAEKLPTMAQFIKALSPE